MYQDPSSDICALELERASHSDIFFSPFRAKETLGFDKDTDLSRQILGTMAPEESIQQKQAFLVVTGASLFAFLPEISWKILVYFGTIAATEKEGSASHPPM